MTLNNVVLPAPLGPIRPVISPCAAARLTSVSAFTPPKRTATFATWSTASATIELSLGGSRSAAGVDKARLLFEEHCGGTGRLCRHVRGLGCGTVRAETLGDLRDS